MRNSILFLFIAQLVAGQVDSLALKKHVYTLAHDSMQGRALGSAGIKKAQTYITSEFEKIKIPPFLAEYAYFFLHDWDVIENVIAEKKGTDTKLKDGWVIVSAHYDHIGIKANKGEPDSIMNGANDNAAGVAMVLELARHLVNKETIRPILFIAFSGEEEGLLGSNELAYHFSNWGFTPYCHINLEMTGTILSGKPGKVYLTGFDKSNLANFINTSLNDSFINELANENEYNLFERSDNFGFYKYLKMPAHTVSTFDFKNFDYYHDQKDEAPLLNFTNMKIITDKLVKVIELLANHKEQLIKLNKP